MPPDIRLRVVSLPATVSRRKNSSSSRSLSRSPSTSTPVSTLIRSAAGRSASWRRARPRRRRAPWRRSRPPPPRRRYSGSCAADHPVGPVEHLVAVLLRHAQQLGDDLQRQLGREIGDEVGRPRLDDLVDDGVGRPWMLSSRSRTMRGVKPLLTSRR